MRNEFWGRAKKRDGNTIMGRGEKAGEKKNNHAAGSPQKAPRLRGEDCRGKGIQIAA